MSIESNTVRPRPTGSIRGRWRERYGDQRVDITADPGRPEKEFWVRFERRWGSQIGDISTVDFRLSREGAETLRDALTAALEWKAEEEEADV